MAPLLPSAPGWCLAPRAPGDNPRTPQGTRGRSCPAQPGAPPAAGQGCAGTVIPSSWCAQQLGALPAVSAGEQDAVLQPPRWDQHLGRAPLPVLGPPSLPVPACHQRPSACLALCTRGALTQPPGAGGGTSIRERSRGATKHHGHGGKDRVAGSASTGDATACGSSSQPQPPPLLTQGAAQAPDLPHSRNSASGLVLSATGRGQRSQLLGTRQGLEHRRPGCNRGRDAALAWRR